MAVQWVILVACVVTLAVSGEEETKEAKEAIKKEHAEEEAPLQVRCCEAEKVLPNVFDIEHNKCLESADMSEKLSDEEFAKNNCIMIDCILRENKMLNEDKSFKEQELKMLFLEKANVDMKEIMEASLALCFDKHNKNTDLENSPICKSGSEQLMSCLTREVLMKCPKSMWNPKRPGCGSEEEKSIPIEETESEEEKKTEEKPAQE